MPKMIKEEEENHADSNNNSSNNIGDKRHSSGNVTPKEDQISISSKSKSRSQTPDEKKPVISIRLTPTEKSKDKISDNQGRSSSKDHE